MAQDYRKWFVRLTSVFALLGLLVGMVTAHEHREVGEYELTFGWRVEPALVGYANGPEVHIGMHDADEGEIAAALEEMEVALQVEVTFGPATKTLELRPEFGPVDHYIADLIPTRAGDYSFRVFGNIGDTLVDEVFTSADGDFSSVEPAGDVTFPDELPPVVELLERIAALEARVEELENGN